MAEILQFPDRSSSARLRASVELAFEAHDPSTRAKKVSEAMAVLDKYDRLPTFLVNAPPNGAFTDAQAEAIRVAVDSYAEETVQMIRSALLEIISLKTILTDMESL